MMHTIVFYLVIVGFFALAILSMWGLAYESGKIHDALKAFRIEAEATDDYKALCDINSRLIAYARKNCFLRAYGEHAREVNIYIHTKAETIRKLSHK